MPEPTHPKNFEDPPPACLVTDDGTVWTLRTVHAQRGPLYAPLTVVKCPTIVMASGAELAADHKARAFTIPAAGDVHLVVQAHDTDLQDAAFRALAPTGVAS